MSLSNMDIIMNNYNFNTPWESDYWMDSNGFFCGLNMVDSLKSRESKGEEILHELPPYNWRASFLVDEYPSCPENWMRSSGRMSSYFVPVKEGHGIWLDFNKNSNHNYHVAIVVSIQGVNAITGLPCNDPHLEQYIDECPVHKTAFGNNRLCEKCGFKWPKQNYISTTSTSLDRLWIDGFRAANGIVQQYLLTEKTMRGVASNIIGSDRVYAIGISFFLSKNPKQVNSAIYGSSCVSSFQDKFNRDCDNVNITYATDSADLSDVINRLSNTPNDPDITITTNHSFYVSSICDCLRGSSLSKKQEDYFILNSHCDCDDISTFDSSLDTDSYYKSHIERNLKKTSSIKNNSLCDSISKPVKNMEIGAGASINQLIGEDNEPLDFWRNEPESLLFINYCSEEDCKNILRHGKVSKKGNKKGFLTDIPHGN